MSSWSPARVLAPLALIGAVLAIYLVTRSELDLGSNASGTTSVASTSSRTTAKGTKARKRTKRKTYTVKKGDVLGSIATKTGVPISDLLDYNDVDAQSLSVGQKLKLTP